MKKYWWLVLIFVIVGFLVFGPKEKEVVKLETRNEKIVTRTEPKKETFKIAIMADVHNDLVSLDKAIEVVKSNGVDTILVAGDITINGTRDELLHAKARLGESGIKYYVVPGNHDLYKSAFSGVFGMEYQIVRAGGIKLILINNGSWRGLGTEQKKWIESEVLECKVIKCVAVMHMPLVNTFSKHVMGEDSAAVAGEAVWLKKILMENNVMTGYSGHLHYNSSYTIDGWETVLVGGMSKDRNTQTPRFTEVEIDTDGKIVNKVIIL